jgi:murein DD-endopeptidase MepM/ murein hydrolase activator NlpD
MKIIIVSKDHGQARSINLGGWTRAFLSVCLLGIPTAIGAWGYGWLVTGERPEIFDANGAVWGKVLGQEKASTELEVEEERASKAQLAALTSKIAELQARLTRLDALGEKLASSAKLEGEFDFSQVPAVGGLSIPSSQALQTETDFLTVLKSLTSKLDSQEQQLSTLDDLLANRSLLKDTVVAGFPVKNAFLSSRFGYRQDPFTGRTSFHSGLDFTARAGSEIQSVAAGVVNWAGRHPEYGNMVEINHGFGFVTRYAHNQSNLVKAGDVIKKGQVVGLVGSTGRSTGNHVHFEVYKNGRVVDPATYVRRNNP